MHSMTFSKLTAAGNDFVCLDNTQGQHDHLLESPQLPAVIRALCRRGLGVGCDGIIFACQVGSGQGIDVCVRFFEPDGSEVELCGNGTACFTYWSTQQQLLPGPEVNILTAAGVATGRRIEPDGYVRVCVPAPRDLCRDINLEVNDQHWNLDYAVAGVPHAVTYVADLDTVNVNSIGALLRHHPHFGQRGANINFVAVHERGHISVRTFEFGVESETLACGTGSAAAAILTAIRYGWGEPYTTNTLPVLVDVRGGETLRIWFHQTAPTTIADVCLETRVRPVYDGVLAPQIFEDLGAVDAVNLPMTITVTMPEKNRQAEP